MSFRRHQAFAINTNAYLDNRLTQFTNVPMYTYNLLVKKNTDICGNLAVGGNLTVNGDISATNFRASGNYYLDNYILIPAGTIIMSASVNEPAGWFHCDGRLLLTYQYPDLFAAIEYKYTDISALNQFQIPDLRGRTAIGSYQSSDSAYPIGLSERTLGQKGGEEEHTLTLNEIPSHSHGITDPGHTHGYQNQVGDQNTDNAFGTETAADQYDYNQTTGSSTTGISINNSGNGQPHNNMQPYLVVRYLIKF